MAKQNKMTLKAVIAAINTLYADTSVPRQETKERLEQIIEEAKMLLDALGE